MKILKEQSLRFNLFIKIERIRIGMNHLGEHIRQKRKRLKLTQVQLAQRAGVGLRLVREVEQGVKETFRMDAVNKILFLFGESLQPAPLTFEEEL